MKITSFSQHVISAVICWKARGTLWTMAVNNLGASSYPKWSFFCCTLRTRSRCTDTTLTDKQRFRRNRKHSQSQTEAHIGLHRARTSTNLRSTLCSPHHLLDNPANNRAGERIAQHAADLLRRDIDGQVGWERLEAQQFPRG